MHEIEFRIWPKIDGQEPQVVLCIRQLDPLPTCLGLVTPIVWITEFIHYRVYQKKGDL
jgi:hypothetical protein